MSNIASLPQRRPQHGWQPPCTCGCSHPPGTPCPPPECRPCPPELSWMQWGQQLLHWNQQIQQLKQLVKEIVSESGGPIFTGPIQGVTDGSDAAPGQVGEWVQAEVTLAYTGEVGQVSVNPIATLQPGDWDVQGYAYCPNLLTGMNFALDPPVTGVAGRFQCFWIGVSETGSEEVVLSTPLCRASLATPSLFAYTTVFNAGGASSAGTCNLGLTARRVR